MASTHNSGLGHGTVGAPQKELEEQIYENKVKENEAIIKKPSNPKYLPSPKHDAKYGWGSINPISTNEEGQKLLDSGYKDGKQIYNVTKRGEIIKFQPDNSPQNGYHPYLVLKPSDIPPRILRKMRDDGKLSKADYNKYRKGKR